MYCNNQAEHIYIYILCGKKHIVVLNVQVRALTNRRSRVRQGRVNSWHHVAWATNSFTLEPTVFNIIIVVIPHIKICTSRKCAEQKALANSEAHK